MHLLAGLAVLAGLVAFAFGQNAARALVGGLLIAVTLAFAYVMYRTVVGTI